ncbi:unnamed protein product, partial [Didymodactylos carnosus]
MFQVNTFGLFCLLVIFSIACCDTHSIQIVNSGSTNTAGYNINIAAMATTPVPTGNFECGDGTIVLNSQVCNFIKECANGHDEEVCADCTFEQDQCRWLDQSFGSFAWKRGQGFTASQNHSGPT